MIEGAQDDTMILQQQQHHHRECEPASPPSPSPSFSGYSSSETLADIAARVISELRLSGGDSQNDDDSLFQPWEEDQNDNDLFPSQNDDDFEFALVSRDQNASPVSADDIFCNGQIRPTYMYPIFNAPYLNDTVPSVSQIPNNSIHRHNDEETETTRRRLPLRKLMFEERETRSCSSSEESGEESLEGVAEGTYCVWNPNAVVARDSKKSNSTGSGSSSKRWKLRELLLRSLSDGKGKKINNNNNSNSRNNSTGDDGGKKHGIVFGVPSKRNSRVAAAKPGSDGGGGCASAERVGKKSVLPYKQELVGLFANVNGLGRNLHQF